MGKYKDELTRAMTLLSEDKRTIFIGQQLVFGGNPMSKTVENISNDRMIEMPVAEEFQLGYCTGLAMGGNIPISFYPRWDFLILASNQLLSHLDKYYLMSDGDVNPVVAIRCAIPSVDPLDPGYQHKADYTDAFDSMLHHVNVVRLIKSDQIVEEYLKILEPDAKPTVFVEYIKYYEEK